MHDPLHRETDYATPIAAPRLRLDLGEHESKIWTGPKPSDAEMQRSAASWAHSVLRINRRLIDTSPAASAALRRAASATLPTFLPAHGDLMDLGNPPQSPISGSKIRTGEGEGVGARDPGRLCEPRSSSKRSEVMKNEWSAPTASVPPNPNKKTKVVRAFRTYAWPSSSVFRLSARAASPRPSPSQGRGSAAPGTASSGGVTSEREGRGFVLSCPGRRQRKTGSGNDTTFFSCSGRRGGGALEEKKRASDRGAPTSAMRAEGEKEENEGEEKREATEAGTVLAESQDSMRFRSMVLSCTAPPSAPSAFSFRRKSYLSSSSLSSPPASSFAAPPAYSSSEVRLQKPAALPCGRGEETVIVISDSEDEPELCNSRGARPKSPVRQVGESSGLRQHISRVEAPSSSDGLPRGHRLPLQRIISPQNVVVVQREEERARTEEPPSVMPANRTPASSGVGRTGSSLKRARSDECRSISGSDDPRAGIHTPRTSGAPVDCIPKKKRGLDVSRYPSSLPLIAAAGGGGDTGPPARNVRVSAAALEEGQPAARQGVRRFRSPLSSSLTSSPAQPASQRMCVLPRTDRHGQRHRRSDDSENSGRAGEDACDTFFDDCEEAILEDLSRRRDDEARSLLPQMLERPTGWAGIRSPALPFVPEGDGGPAGRGEGGSGSGRGRRGGGGETYSRFSAGGASVHINALVSAPFRPLGFAGGSGGVQEDTNSQEGGFIRTGGAARMRLEEDPLQRHVASFSATTVKIGVNVGACSAVAAPTSGGTGGTGGGVPPVSVALLSRLKVAGDVGVPKDLDARAALEFLKAEFHLDLKTRRRGCRRGGGGRAGAEEPPPPVPFLALLSQLTTLVPNRTLLERQLDAMRQAKEICILNLPTHASFSLYEARQGFWSGADIAVIPTSELCAATMRAADLEAAASAASACLESSSGLYKVPGDRKSGLAGVPPASAEDGAVIRILYRTAAWSFIKGVLENESHPYTFTISHADLTRALRSVISSHGDNGAQTLLDLSSGGGVGWENGDAPDASVLCLNPRFEPTQPRSSAAGMPSAEDQISMLLRMGCLLCSGNSSNNAYGETGGGGGDGSPRSTTNYLIGIPGGGSLVSSIRDGRRELLLWFKRRNPPEAKESMIVGLLHPAAAGDGGGSASNPFATGSGFLSPTGIVLSADPTAARGPRNGGGRSGLVDCGSIGLSLKRSVMDARFHVRDCLGRGILRRVVVGVTSVLQLEI